jgi:hypothetical protein
VEVVEAAAVMAKAAPPLVIQVEVEIRVAAEIVPQVAHPVRQLVAA